MGLLSKTGSAIKKIGNAVKKGVEAVGRGFMNVVNAAKSIFRRILKAFDLLASLLGFRWKKRMMLRVFILSERGSPVVPQDEVERWVTLVHRPSAGM